MTFAYCPEGGLPRLLRFDLTEPYVVARLDKANNLVHINRELFDRLDEFGQKQVETMQTVEIIADFKT